MFTTTNAFAVLSDADGMTSDPEITVTVTGEDAIEVETESFGFVALNGDTKVKLFPDTFPESSIPVSSASLFTIANKRGLFAAAGPSTFMLGTTESLRKTFTTAPSSSAIVNYSPTLSLPLPTPISHIVFNSSENFLILGASSGGLAIYSVDSLSNDQNTPLFEVGTEGLPLHEIRPNPNPEYAHLITILTKDGSVRILNLDQRAFAPGKQGDVLRTGVSTTTWSQRGKQIICGLTDGSCVQIKPEGDQQAEIPKPPGLTGHFVSHLAWLENNLFIIALTPIQSNPQEPNNDTVFYVFTRTKEIFQFQKLPDPTPPYGMSSRQAYHFCTEIKHWGPHLQDALILANTSSVDIGLITRFSTAVHDVPAGTFTTTMIANDSRRAALPLDEQGLTDTSPIGVILDLSNRSKVSRPIAGEELEETGPLPIIMVLNNESLVTAWHIVYSDAVRKNIEYTQLVASKEKLPAETTQSDQASVPSAFTASSSPFPALSGSNKPFNAPTTSTASPAFASPAFGGRPTFGQPSFGRPGFGQATFGQSGWAPASSAAPNAPNFGSSPFGSNVSPGFGKFANAGGFAAAAAASGNGPTWAVKDSGSSTTTTSPFGGLQSLSNNASSFGGSVGGPSSVFGSSAVPLKIPSTFQADNNTPNMSDTSDTKGALFGSFGTSLGGALGGDKMPSADADMDTETPRIATPVDKEEDMDSSSSAPPSPPRFVPELLGRHVSTLPPALESPPPAPLPPSPVVTQKLVSEESGPVPATDAPLPPDWMPKQEKEKSPDMPLPPIPDSELQKSKPSTDAPAGTKETSKEIIDSNASSLGALGSVAVSEKPTTGPFGSGTSSFGTGLSGKPAGVFGETSQQPTLATQSQAQIEKSTLTSSSKPTPGLFGAALTPSSPSTPPQSVFPTTAQQHPPAPATTQKDATPGGSVFDSPLPDVGGGLFARSSKKKPVKSERGDLAKEKPVIVSRVSAPSATKSALGKKVEVSRTKSVNLSTIHRFGALGKTRQALKPSPLSRRQQESEDEDEEYEDEGEDDSNDEEEEIDETEEEETEEEDISTGRSMVKGGRVKEGKQQEPKLMSKQRPLSPLSSRTAISAASTSIPQQSSRVSTTTAPIAPPAPEPEPEPEDERARKLLNSAIPVEPNPNPPVFVLTDKIVEASPEDEFEGIYDKAYESCNVMVNSIGNLSRNLEAYVSAHNQCPDLNKHTKLPPLQQLKEVDEWRLCEIVHLNALLEDEAQSYKAPKGRSGVTGLQDMLDDLSKGFLKLQNKRTELKLVEEFLKNPQAAGHSRYLPPDQTLQQREIRNKLAMIQNQLVEAEKRITLLKATLVARDRGKPGVAVNPPTVEAVQNTISKLTGMVEKKNSDVEYLSELLRRLKEKRRLGGASLGQSTYTITTPAKGKGKDTCGDERVLVAEGLTLTSRARWDLHNDELEMEEAREEISLRKQKGSKLRKAMILAGARVTRGA